MEANLNDDLLRNIIDSSLDMIQVFKAVRNEHGEIIDFVCILNNKASESFYGDVIGKSFLTLNPGVVREGVFETFKQVVETGKPNQSVRHYVHEQFDGWFLQSAVKQGDGLATTTKDISDIKKAEEELRAGKEYLQATLDSSLYAIQAFKAVRDKAGKIIDFTWVFTNDRWNRQYGDMTGKSLLANNPGVVETGLFEKFVQVTETGITIDHEQYYSHEQFHQQWFHQTLVKVGDGFVTNTEDITQRKKAEQEVREKQALLESVLNNTESSIMLLRPLRDGQGRIEDFEYQYTNRQTLMSVDRNALTGKRMTEEFPEFKHSQLFERYASVADTGESFRGKVNISPYGHAVWTQVFAQRFEDSVLITYFDITEQKKIKQLLTDSKELVQTVFDVSINPIAFHKAIRDSSGKIIDFEFRLQNEKAREYTQGNRVGQRYSEAYPGIKDTVVFEKYCYVVETGNTLDTEVEVALRGRTYWFHLMAAKLGDGLVATAVDITQQKQMQRELLNLKEEIAQHAEYKYQALFKSLDQGFQVYEVIYDEDGKPADFRYLETNQAFEQQTGLTNVAGKLGSEVLSDLESYWFDYFEKILESPVPLRSENYNQATGRWYSVSSFRVTGDGRPVIGALFTDITERKEIEKQQDFLSTFSDVLRSEQSVDAVANRAIQLLIDYLELDRSYITSYDLDRNRAELDYQIGNDSVPPLPDHFILSDYPEAFKAIINETFVIEDELERQGLSAAEILNSSKLGMRAMVAATVRNAGHHPLWSMVAVSSRPRRWTQREISLLEGVAERTWAAVEKARADHALRKSEARLAATFESVPVGLAFIDLSGKIILSNAEYRRFLPTGIIPSRDPATITRWRVWDNNGDVVEPQNFPTARALRGETSLSGQKMLYTNDVGREIWTNVTSVPMYDDAGNITGAVSVISDIDISKRNEDALMEAELQYRKRLQQEVHERTADLLHNRELLQGTLNSNPEMIQVFKAVRNESGDIIDFIWILNNHASEQVYGDVIGKSLLQNNPGVKREGIFKSFVEVTETGIPQQYEKHYAHEQFQGWFNQSVVQLNDGVATTTVNITGRKQAELKLQQSRDRLQSVFDTTLIQLAILEAVREDNDKIVDFEIKLVNKEMEALTARKDLVGKLYGQEYPGIHQTGVFESIVKAIETGQPQELEYGYSHEGFRKWFSSTFVKLNDGVVATNLDITARKQAEEERFKNYLLLQQSEALASMGSWDFEPLSGIFTWSDGMYRLFDVQKGTKVHPEIYLDYATNDGRAAAKRVVKYIRDGKRDFEETLEIYVVGRVKLLHLKAAVVRNKDGRTERVLGVDMDITATRAAEEKIHQMEAEQQLEIFKATLRTQEEERRRISESLHNGIGQMLYGIKMSLGQLSVQTANSDPEGFETSKKYTGDLLSDAIRDTRRISHELMPAVLEEYGLNAAVKDICEQMQNEVKFRCITDLDDTQIDKYMQLAVFRTLQELMLNVVKHSKATDARTELWTESGQIILQVSDNGRGIDPANQVKTGIGLASIRSKVDLLNGTVDIQTEMGKGTSVTVRLPHSYQKGPTS